MPPASGSVSAAFFRCQFRSIYCLRTRSPVLATSLLLKRRAATAVPRRSKDLIILEPPRPRFRRDDIRRDPLDNVRLEGMSKTLLVYECETAIESTNTYIAFLRPSPNDGTITRVSQQRYQQLYDQIDRAFTVPQLKTYFDKMVLGAEGKVVKSRLNRKRDLVHALLKDLWEVEIAKGKDPRVDFVVAKEVKSSRRDISFLIREGKCTPYGPLFSAHVLHQFPITSG